MTQHVTFQRYACWIDYGALRFSFVKVRRFVVNGSQHLQTLLRVSDRKGRAAIYTPTNGGFVRTGFTSSEVLPTRFISMNIYDRSQIELELLEAEEQNDHHHCRQ